MAASERPMRSSGWGVVNTDKGWVRLKVNLTPVLTAQKSHKTLTEVKPYPVEIHSELRNLF
jgi:hypothetical protein